MRANGTILCVLWLALFPRAGAGQQPEALSRAIEAREQGDFPAVVQAVEAALPGLRMRRERLQALELLAYAYMAMDSTDRAVDALRRFVTIDPDRDFDPDLYTPQFLSLHTIALRSELIMRQVTVDSQSFVAGSGELAISFELTRPASVDLLVIGPGLDTSLGAVEVSRIGIRRWGAVTSSEEPVREGTYTLLLRATQFGTVVERGVEVAVRHDVVDTLPHVSSLPGFEERPEFARPPPDWRPMGLATLVAGVATGLVLAMETATPAEFGRRELIAIDLAALASGLVMSLRRPPPQPVEANIAFNQLLRDQIADENARRADENARRRQQVVVTITPAQAEASP